MTLYFFIKVQHTGDTDLGQADMHGVWLMMTPEATRSLLSWEPVSPWILTAWFNSKDRKGTIIHSYAPTNATDEGDEPNWFWVTGSKVTVSFQVWDSACKTLWARRRLQFYSFCLITFKLHMYVDDERRDPVYFAWLGQILWSTLPPPPFARGCHALQCLVIEDQVLLTIICYISTCPHETQCCSMSYTPEISIEDWNRMKSVKHKSNR